MKDEAREVFEWVDKYLDKVIFHLDREDDALEDAVGYVIEGLQADIGRERFKRQTDELKRRLDIQKDQHVPH